MFEQQSFYLMLQECYASLPICFILFYISADMEAEEGIDPDYFPDTIDQNYISNSGLSKLKGIS